MLVWYEKYYSQLIIANSYPQYVHEMFKSSKVYCHAIPEIYNITEKGTECDIISAVMTLKSLLQCFSCRGNKI